VPILFFKQNKLFYWERVTVLVTVLPWRQESSWLERALSLLSLLTKIGVTVVSVALLVIFGGSVRFFVQMLLFEGMGMKL
jgi:hypothetical protein